MFERGSRTNQNEAKTNIIHPFLRANMIKRQNDDYYLVLDLELNVFKHDISVYHTSFFKFPKKNTMTSKY